MELRQNYLALIPPLLERKRRRTKMLRDKTSTSKINDQFLQEMQTIVATPKPHSKDDKLEDRKQPSNCVESSKPSLYDKILEQECQPPKDVENEKFLRSKNLSKENKKN